MIDAQSRARLLQQQNQQKLLGGLNTEVTSRLDSISEKTHNVALTNLGIVDRFNKLTKSVDAILQFLAKPLDLPKKFNIFGDVTVTKQPPVVIKNFSDLEDSFASLENSIRKISYAIAQIPPAQINVPEIKVPKSDPPNVTVTVPDIKIPEIKIPKFEFPKQEVQKNLTPLLQDILNELAIIRKTNRKGGAIPDLQPQFDRLIESLQSVQSQEFKFPKTISVDNFPVQMTPNPVTNIWLNPNQGVLKTTDNTVGTNPTQLPQYGQLFGRRSLIIYNNSANTIYIGGSDVTVSNGLPIPASSYGPSIDAGYDLTVYGIASQINNDVRVIEISKDRSPNVQE